ncbi:MAG: restriction endonuclease [Capnocytophaga sp.]|nr:restriction endonuclease [Capnocytophaga sp.]
MLLSPSVEITSSVAGYNKVGVLEDIYIQEKNNNVKKTNIGIYTKNGVVALVLDDTNEIFDISKLKKLTPRVPTGKNLTNLKFEDFTQLLSKSEIEKLSSTFVKGVDDIMKTGDKTGRITEDIAIEIFRKQGYTVTKDIGKYGLDNGFDVVAYKGTLDNPTEILIVECKQMKQKVISEFDNIAATAGYDKASGVVLNKANPETGLPTQMSMDWTFKHVATKLESLGGSKTKLYYSLDKNKSMVERYVFAIDKSDGSGYFVKLSNNFLK